MARKHARTQSDPHAARRGRLRNLRGEMRDKECDAALITNPNDIRYITGFSGEDSYTIVSSRSVVVISDFRFEEDLGVVDGIARVHLRKDDIVDAVRTVVGDLDPERLAFQSEHVSVHLRSRLVKAVGARRLHPTVGLLSRLRLIKDEAEVRSIRKAVRIQQRALEATLESIKPGRTEASIAAELEYNLKSLGAEGVSFPIIVAARANGSKPHAAPGKTKTGKNQPLLIDWGARVDGYCSDMTRTICLGAWPKPLRAVYGVVLDAQLSAMKAVRSGVRARDVDAVARSIISDAGFGDFFGHGLGHGIGLDVHEGPRVSRQSDTVLEAGMIVTIEPGVYLPGVGGVRIEDDVLVTESGAKNLCSLPKSLDWATR